MSSLHCELFISQLTTNFSANYQLTTVFLAKYQLTANPTGILNYDGHLPHYSLFFYKSHVRYCSLPRHNAFLCYEYYLLAEVVQKISNYKQNMLLVTLQ